MEGIYANNIKICCLIFYIIFFAPFVALAGFSSAKGMLLDILSYRPTHPYGLASQVLAIPMAGL